MLKELLLSCIAVISPVVAQPVADLSNLPLLNPDLSERQTSKLILQNGLQVLLISDPKADSSAAALSVEVGSWSDPEQYAGMAHFCEHMLFRGSFKYPEDNRFTELLSNYAGSHNAFTAPDRTVYGFSCQIEGFLDVLDTFSRFFIDPLFNASAVSKEMHAVDQEFEKNIENDYWRQYMVFKETGNPDHPNRMFSVGNSETLGNIPPQALKDWHAKYYSADQMHLVLYSSLPLDTLEAQAKELFAAVPVTKYRSLNPDIPLLSKEQKGHIIYLEPVQDRRQISFSWELPRSISKDPTKPAQILSYALSRGQKNSLSETLKKAGLVDSCYVSARSLGSEDHLFFDITLDLTQKGVSQIETVGRTVFEAIASFKQEPLPTYLFQEHTEVSRLGYQYQTRKHPFSYVLDLADALCDEPLSTFPRNSLFATEYNLSGYQKVLSELTVENSVVFFMIPSNTSLISMDRTERWSKASYALRPLPETWAKSWNQAKPNSEIAIAPPNPFLPSELSLVPDPNLSSQPIAFAHSDFGTAYYVRCPEFSNPESVYHLHILSPALDGSAKSAVLAELYLDHLTDLLAPTMDAAAPAGSSFTFSFKRNRLNLSISGFSEKHPELLQAILNQMPNTPPTQEQFAIYFDRTQKAYQNSEKALAVSQAHEILGGLLRPEQKTSKEKLAAIQTITYEEFLSFHQTLFKQTAVEALFAGNLPLKEAEAAWLDIVHILGKNPYTERPDLRQFRYPAHSGPYSLRSAAPVQGGATLLVIDEGPFSFSSRAAQELLHSVLSEAFFNELRSRQKTGYINQSQAFDIEGQLYAIFAVQSTTYSPEELLYRFEHFIEDFNSELADKIPVERFNTLKVSLATALKNRCRNLRDKADLWDMLAFEKGADFNFIEKRINAYEQLSYEEFLKMSNRFLSRENRQRIGILVEGKLTMPFAYESIDTPKLQEVVQKTLVEEPEEQLTR